MIRQKGGLVCYGESAARVFFVVFPVATTRSDHRRGSEQASGSYAGSCRNVRDTWRGEQGKDVFFTNSYF